MCRLARGGMAHCDPFYLNMVITNKAEVIEAKVSEKVGKGMFGLGLARKEHLASIACNGSTRKGGLARNGHDEASWAVEVSAAASASGRRPLPLAFPRPPPSALEGG